MDYISEAKKVFDTEINSLELFRDNLDNGFCQIIDAIQACNGRVVLTGMGKAGHIARKIAATLSSLGTPAFFLHPAEALHGDLGMVTAGDLVIAISYSGESEEITRLIPSIKAIGAKIVAISGNENSALVKYSDISQILPPFQEACYLNLAPTSSTTAALVYGDALAVVVSKMCHFTKENFGLYHPAGSLGKKLFTTVKDLMHSGEEDATVAENAALKDAIIEMGKKGLGMVSILDGQCNLVGIITDGDLRRLLEKGVDVYSLNVFDVMTPKPITVQEENMAIEVLQILRKHNISNAPVIAATGKATGTIRLQSILNAGIVI